MDPRLLHIYGPLYVNSYGLAIAIGVIVFVILCQNNKQLSKLVTADQFNSLFTIGVFSALAGGRIWFAITESSSIDSWLDLLKPWMGGFSVLGSVVGILFVIPLFFYANIKFPFYLFWTTSRLIRHYYNQFHGLDVFMQVVVMECQPMHGLVLYIPTRQASHLCT